MAKIKAKMVVTGVKFKTNDSSYKARCKYVKKEVDIFVDEKMQGLEMCLWIKVEDKRVSVKENEVKDSRKNYLYRLLNKNHLPNWSLGVGNWNSTVG